MQTVLHRRSAPPPDLPGAQDMLQWENRVLLHTLGSIQRRMTATASVHSREVEALEALVVRLRGELIVRDTVAAMLRDELRRLEQRLAAALA